MTNIKIKTTLATITLLAMGACSSNSLRTYSEYTAAGSEFRGYNEKLEVTALQLEEHKNYWTDIGEKAANQLHNNKRAEDGFVELNEAIERSEHNGDTNELMSIQSDLDALQIKIHGAIVSSKRYGITKQKTRNFEENSKADELLKQIGFEDK